ncbi:hypothetical protein H0H92_003179 [Tricholoma furcatifolium]|nr:hypothetical protein H0H92_003179 [Tricholoma furcatifolium]
MAKFALSFAGLLALIPLATAQSGAWGQCGGIGWTGATASTTASGTTTTATTTTTSSTSSTTTSGTALPTGTSNAGLSNVAKAAGKKYFGSATDNPELTDTAYVAELSNTNDFTQLTPGNSMKWDATEPSQGTFTFTNGDAIVTLAQKNGQLVRDSWDVINAHDEVEPFNDDGTWRSDVFYNTMGESYVPVALNAARAADPNAKLYINDYNIEGTGAKSTAMVNLVKSLQAAGVPIDGIGIQGHLIVGEVPTTMVENMQQFTALGVEVAITELDIRMTLPETAALLEQQKADYQTVMEACKSVSGCVGVTVWDYTDKNLVKKPAYDGIVAGWTS